MGKHIGVFGMGVMGRSLALNLARNHYPVAVYDIDKTFTERICEFGGEELSRVIRCADLAEFAEALTSPKQILVMVTAGEPVDHVMQLLSPYLGAGDMVIDCGNSYFLDTQRRAEEWEKKGIHFCGTGVSGGERGAREGAALMPGGSREAYEAMAEIYKAISTTNEEGVSCCGYVGPGGAGHFVKMVHNGIEYTDMQLISECCQLMKKYLQFSPLEISNVLEDWNQGYLNSYLLDITIKILRRNDEISGLPMVDIIKDVAREKGTGSWTSKEAFNLHTAAPAVADAVFARYISACETDRELSVKRFKEHYIDAPKDKAGFLKSLKEAFYAAKICCYSQGFSVMSAASKKYGWNLSMENIAVNWEAGCIIQSQFLYRTADAYRKGLESQLFLAEEFAEVIENAEEAWRSVCIKTMELGIPSPILCGTLTYFDGFHTKQGTASLIQAQRDFFGAHTYNRIDMEGSFHTKWE